MDHVHSILGVASVRIGLRVDVPVFAMGTRTWLSVSKVVSRMRPHSVPSYLEHFTLVALAGRLPPGLRDIQELLLLLDVL